MKRQLLGLLALAVLCGGIAACGGPAEAVPQDTPAEPVTRQAAPLSTEPETENDAQSPDSMEPAAADVPQFPGIPEPSELPVSQTVDGWTLTLTRIEGDLNCGFLYLDITAPEGTVLDADNYWLQCFPLLETGEGSGWSEHFPDDEDKTDNKITCVVEMSFGSDVRGVKGVLNVEKLEAIYWSADHQSDRVKTLTTAQWELPFRMPDQFKTIAYEPRQVVDTSQGAVTVDAVEVGSCSAVLQFAGQTVLDHPVDLLLRKALPRSGSIPLQFKSRDGGEVAASGSSSFPRKEGVGLTMVVTFREPIEPGNLEALVLDGTEVPLTQ